MPPSIRTPPYSAEVALQEQQLWANHPGVGFARENSIGIQLRLIPPGEFLMGSTDQEIQRQVANTEIEWMR